MKIGAQMSEQTLLCFFLPAVTAPDSEMKPSGGPALPGLQERGETCAAARRRPRGCSGRGVGSPEGGGRRGPCHAAAVPGCARVCAGLRAAGALPVSAVAPLMFNLLR